MYIATYVWPQACIIPLYDSHPASNIIIQCSASMDQMFVFSGMEYSWYIYSKSQGCMESLCSWDRTLFYWGEVIMSITNDEYFWTLNHTRFILFIICMHVYYMIFCKTSGVSLFSYFCRTYCVTIDYISWYIQTYRVRP